MIVNAAYHPVHSPSEPAFDWVTWNQIHQTKDRILQESVGYYNPAMQVIVFVLLPSPSGNSVAIWRRKLPIPNNIRLAYQAQITQAMASLRKEYPVLVDEYVCEQGCELDLMIWQITTPTSTATATSQEKAKVVQTLAIHLNVTSINHALTGFTRIRYSV